MCTDTVSKVHLQEDAAVVLERGCNFVPAPTLVAQLFLLNVRRVPEVNGPMGRFNRRAPKEDCAWDNREMRMQRIVTFMQQRHNLSLARQYSEQDMFDRIAKQNRFFVRLTNMAPGVCKHLRFPTTCADLRPSI